MLLLALVHNCSPFVYDYVVHNCSPFVYDYVVHNCLPFVYDYVNARTKPTYSTRAQIKRTFYRRTVRMKPNFLFLHLKLLFFLSMLFILDAQQTLLHKYWYWYCTNTGMWNADSCIEAFFPQLVLELTVLFIYLVYVLYAVLIRCWAVLTKINLVFRYQSSLFLSRRCKSLKLEWSHVKKSNESSNL